MKARTSTRSSRESAGRKTRVTPSSRSRRPAPAKRRRRSREESKGALIEATLKLMAEGEALTSVSITREAGLAQPTFYAYFKGVDECRMAAAESAASRLAKFEEERQERLRKSPMDISALADELEAWLEQTKVTGPLRDALAPYARDKSALGGLVRAVGEHTRSRLADQLFSIAKSQGVGPEHYRVFVQQAEILIASTAATGRLIHSGELSDVRSAAWVLARNIFAVMQATIAACGGDVPGRRRRD